MCKICGKVMHSDNWKRHMSSKHGNVNKTLLYTIECHPEFEMITNDAPYNNKSFAEGCKVKELDDSLVTYTANLKFELQRYNEVYYRILILENRFPSY